METETLEKNKICAGGAAGPGLGVSSPVGYSPPVQSIGAGAVDTDAAGRSVPDPLRAAPASSDLAKEHLSLRNDKLGEAAELTADEGDMLNKKNNHSGPRCGRLTMVEAERARQWLDRLRVRDAFREAFWADVCDFPKVPSVEEMAVDGWADTGVILCAKKDSPAAQEAVLHALAWLGWLNAGRTVAVVDLWLWQREFYKAAGAADFTAATAAARADLAGEVRRVWEGAGLVIFLGLEQFIDPTQCDHLLMQVVRTMDLLSEKKVPWLGAAFVSERGRKLLPGELAGFFAHLRPAMKQPLTVQF